MSFRDFLNKMDEQRQVLHIKEQVSTRFEISRVMNEFDDEGPLLLFEKVRSFKTNIVASVCGTRKRVCAALRVRPDCLYGRVIDAWRSPRKTKVASDGLVRQNARRNVDLSRIPFLTHFEKDAGAYITSAVIHARDSDCKIENISVHRLQVLDRKHLAIRLVPRHLFKLWQMAKEAGKDLDVAVSVGVHPAVLLAASSPVPFGVSEFDVANNLLSGGLRLIECEHVNALAPADSELVLECKISTEKDVEEGPFVDVSGTYDVKRRQPVVEVVGIMHRNDYVYHGLLPSGAEHRILMGLPHEVMMWEAVSKVLPKVYAVNLSKGGCGWLHAVISVEKQLDGDGKNALLAAFAAHPSLKHAVVVDSDINVYDASEVEWAIATRFQADEDLFVVKNARGSTLDSSADQETGMTTKVGVDATRPFGKPKEKFEKAKIPSSKRVETLVHRLKGV
jgi:2,5-furandicarboxylate decarboxylase 1